MTSRGWMCTWGRLQRLTTESTSGHRWYRHAKRKGSWEGQGIVADSTGDVRVVPKDKGFSFRAADEAMA